MSERDKEAVTTRNDLRATWAEPPLYMGSKAPKVRKSALKEWKMLNFWGENHRNHSFCGVEMSMVKVQGHLIIKSWWAAKSRSACSPIPFTWCCCIVQQKEYGFSRVRVTRAHSLATLHFCFHNLHITSCCMWQVFLDALVAWRSST